MATFYNKATLSYNGTSTDSNIVSGEIIAALTASKQALVQDYDAGEIITYAISLVNSAPSSLTGLTVTDNLGSYSFGSQTLVPLTYLPGSLYLYVNGVQQPTPVITSASPLTVTGISIPAGGNALLLYNATVNGYAPLDLESEITNTGSVTGPSLVAPVPFTETIAKDTAAKLSISKSLCPETITESGEITYTFLIRNTGNLSAGLAENVTITDTFLPVLNNITVTYNGTIWTEPANYTYDETTGIFQTLPGSVTVPPATYAQNPVTGEWTTTPGVAIIRVTGTI